MKKIIVFLMTMFLSSLAYAESAAQALDRQLSSTHIFQAQFIQATNSAQFGNQVTAGEMTLERPGKFRWQITKPDQQLLISDGNKLWIYDQDLEQVIVQPVNQRLDETPALLLAGKADSIQQFFTVKQVKDKDGNDWYELKAKDQEGLVSKVMLQFSNNIVKEMQIYDNLGQRTDISFSNIKTNIRLTDDYFIFTPPKGVEVIDQG